MRINKENLEGKILKFNFDVKKFNFLSIFQKHFFSIRIDNLQNLHSLAPVETLPASINENINFQVGQYYLVSE